MNSKISPKHNPLLLDKAIEVIQQQLKDWQPKVIDRPEYPDRHSLIWD